MGWIWGGRDESDDILLEFVFLKRLPGIRRWQMVWRTNPLTPWSAGQSKFISGSPKTAYITAMAKNAELAQQYRAGVRLERQREVEKRRQARQQRDEAHAAGADTGEHTSGAWWRCPVCNPDMDKHRRREDDDE